MQPQQRALLVLVRALETNRAPLFTNILTLTTWEGVFDKTIRNKLYYWV